MLIIPSVCTFFFSQIQFFTTHFSAPMRARVFKVCMHLQRVEVYCVQENHGAGIFLFFCFFFFSSLPGQSPGRAVALPLALASTFTLKFFKSLYFPDHLIDLVHI